MYLESHPQRGRGVFARNVVPAGTVVEESPVLVLSQSQWEEGRMNDTILGEYGFCWANRGMAIGLGLASLFNHSNRPNVNFIRDFKASTILFRTVKTIQPGEELCICYAADESKLWFVDSTAKGNLQGPAHAVTEEEEETFPLIEPGDLFDLDEADLRREEREKRRKGGSSGGKGTRRRRNATLESGQDGPPGSTHVSVAQHGKNTLGEDEGAQGIKSPTPDTATVALASRVDRAEPSSGILSPRPVRYSESSLPAVVFPGPLPPPLHSTPTPSPNTPPDLGVADLVPELDWRADNWSKKNEDGHDSGECTKIRGPADLEEVEQETGLMKVWVVDVDDPKLTREIVQFSRASDFQEDNMRHLKRITRRSRPDGSGEHTLAALCTEGLHTAEELSAMMASFHPTLANLRPYIYNVPRTAGRGTAEAKEKSLIWPVNLAPLINRANVAATWSLARREWVRAGIHRALSVAISAADKGEVPVGVFCASPPEQFWPTHDGFIQPTIGLRAEGIDTRLSANHPLRHAVLNCVRAVAHLRTVPPFSTAIPTRNGADYLLTSLSLFITHEPCVMCCMALLHSRVREVFYIFPRKLGGGFEGGLGIHGRKDLNHRFEVWRWDGQVDEDVRRRLEVDESVAV